ncbi:unnamed protein product [Clonostachys chloroleuca]|uniref:Uncharacterized protein n=1 Tax=Clonostachys chloroleuca TaxID=1926264 RepID=A0AA35MDV5_9HYPO|nr:unnamed protein product [Clonostachys chloroleuca]
MSTRADWLLGAGWDATISNQGASKKGAYTDAPMLVIPSSGPTMDPSYPGKISTELAVQASKVEGGGCGHLLFLAVAHVVAVPRIANCLSQLTSHDFYPTALSRGHHHPVTI